MVDSLKQRILTTILAILITTITTTTTTQNINMASAKIITTTKYFE